MLIDEAAKKSEDPAMTERTNDDAGVSESEPAYISTYIAQVSYR